MVNVLKFDGTKQPFDRNKVYNTCIRMRATPQQARDVTDKVAGKVYEGISTKKVLQLIFACLQEVMPETKQKIDLREAISLMRSKPDFERFIQLLLEAEGYEIEANRIVEGKCVDHEIDAVARKSGETTYVEVKHHIQFHTFTGLDVFLIARATFEDLKGGGQEGKNDYDFSRALVVTNTKMSEHAMRYADCRGISYIAWRDPPGRGLEEIIERNNFYPITMLRGIDSKTMTKLGDAGIVVLKQLTDGKLEEISEYTRIPVNILANLSNSAKEILQ